MVLTQDLNKEQQKGVYTTEGPVLILAGAGSGKTRVLTNRTAYLIKERFVNPYNILAITFTNKAAREMRERIDDMVGHGSEGMWVMTFHAMCVRILRRFADRIGYDTDFSIYDTDDSKTLMKEVLKRLQIDDKMFKEKACLNAISSAKNELIDYDSYRFDAGGDYRLNKLADIYEEYQKSLKKNNAMDFDDLIMNTVKLLSVDDEVRGSYQERFQYIMVDEYQDTNTAQFKLIELLAGRYKNLCVVGDDDQSIYKFRGANIRNILDFEKVYPDATVIKLEQNYRSTKNILNAANGVIANNTGRKVKKLWTEHEEGSKIKFEQFDNALDEASFIVSDIAGRVGKGECAYKDCAVLYRTNAQSRILEEKFVARGIPYKLVGGVNFYSRKEIKDILAYLKTIDNGKDDVAVRRILNVPKRGIGQTSENRVADFAIQNDISFYDALVDCDIVPGIGAAAKKIAPFTALIGKLRGMNGTAPISMILEKLLEETGYVDDLVAEGTDEAKERIDNIDEFISKVVDYEERNENPTLSGLLEEVALIADIDGLDENSDYTVLMTLHGAKGLEFDNVYMSGMEDGLFPSNMTIIDGDKDELEEERRLCYVGITRAKKNLVMTAARARMIRGETNYSSVSRFIKEIPEEVITGYFKKYKTEDDEVFNNVSEFKKAKEGWKKNSFLDTMKAYSSMTSSSAKAALSSMKTGKDMGTVDGGLEYGVGDRVRHIKFGEGTVLSITDGGRDYEVSVEFDTAGVRKMFASFAKLKKV
ncbi:MAG: UvrD-helicase domain-containing protein [Lachnospiraceae bacterium]|nr:UvrD-helicase domain-containing protein [Lachnospiraceae bacterium]